MFALYKKGELKDNSGSQVAPDQIAVSGQKSGRDERKVVMRNTMRNWMLGTALVAGLLGTGAVSAKAEVRDFHANREIPNRGVADRGVPDRGFYDRGGFDRGGYRAPARDYVRPAYRPGFGPGFDPGFGVGVAVGPEYIPPSPGAGYVWGAGYYNAGVWVPGAWRLRGGYGPVARFDHGRDFDRGYGRGFDHGFRR